MGILLEDVKESPWFISSLLGFVSGLSELDNDTVPTGLDDAFGFAQVCLEDDVSLLGDETLDDLVLNVAR